MGFIKEQIRAIKQKDPSITSTIEVFLYPCFKTLIYYKVAHYFYNKKHYLLARYISEKAKRVSSWFKTHSPYFMDILPERKI